MPRFLTLLFAGLLLSLSTGFAKSVAFEFETNGDAEGWKDAGGITGFTQKTGVGGEGVLTAGDVTDGDPKLVYNRRLTLGEGLKWDSLQIRFRQLDGNAGSPIEFLNLGTLFILQSSAAGNAGVGLSDGTTFNGNKGLSEDTFAVSLAAEGAGDWQLLTVDFTNADTFKNSDITSIRFDPLGSPDATRNFEVDYVRVNAVPSLEVRLPNIFGDHMVLQRDQANPVWGTAGAGEAVTVRIGGQSHATTANEHGKWRVELEPLPVGGPYTLEVVGKNRLRFEDVLVGEVWICSGQSNMKWPVLRVNNAEVELATAANPQIRLMTVAYNGTQEAQDDVEGQWVPASAETVTHFSAVGFLFGKHLQEALDVPIGLIDNSWPGSAAEAWVSRDALEAAGSFDEYLQSWKQRSAEYTDEVHAEKVAQFKDWIAAGRPNPRQRPPSDPRIGQHRPANIYNGMVHPLIGYGIRGVIWYQGENNTKQGRAAQYHELFSLLITEWRDLWQQGDFPFYWVQLADYQEEVAEPGEDDWAELREAQTKTLALPNTGQAVIIDAGEGRDIHPRDKQTVANRLVRHALAKDYGFDIASESPRFASMEVQGQSIILSFDHVSEGLRAFDTNEIKGFSIAGVDGQFVWADARIIGKDKVKVSSQSVTNPVAVRYAWAANPVANLQDRNGLPVTPFRTDTNR